MPGIACLGMGLSLFPPLRTAIRKKFKWARTISPWLILFLIFFTLFAVTVETEQSETDELLDSIEAYLDEVEENRGDFIDEHGGKSPEEIVEILYLDVLNERGESGSDYVAPFAEYFANLIFVDVNKLSAIQSWNGTNGVENALEAMDQEAPGVAEAYGLIQHYHFLGRYDDEYFEDRTADQILSEYADVYRKIYGETLSLSTYKTEQLNELLSLSDLNESDLMQVLEHHISVNRIFELFPEDYPEKMALIEVVEW